MAALKGKYREEEDELGRFLEERCTLGEGLRVGSDELYGVYTGWCKEQGMPEKAVLWKTPFKRGLEARGLETRRLTSGMYYFGLKIGGPE
jgi:putative DNA primase/helicase